MAIITTPPQNFDLCYFTGAPHTRRVGATNYHPVQITLQHVDPSPKNFGTRPIKVEGFIIPVTVGVRTTTPQPSSGFNTTTLSDVDPGHVMALHLGGPDVPENIVPQWRSWQRLGNWREMERYLDGYARRVIDDSRPFGGLPTRSVYYTVELEYRSTGTITPTLVAWSFPKAFYVTASIWNLDRTGTPTIIDPFNNLKFEGVPDSY